LTGSFGPATTTCPFTTSIPTVCHAWRTASCSALPAPKRAPAASNVASAHCWNVALLVSRRVSASYQILPARSQAKPPRIVASVWNALFGMP
jgi:hypothetical protein